MDSAIENNDLKDWSDALALILEEAQAAHRPRQLFGIQLGPRSISTRPASTAMAAVPAPPVAVREPLSRERIESFKQSYQVISDQLKGRATAQHPWVLVHHASQAEGTRGMLDALETHLMRAGAVKMQSWLQEMSNSPEACVALSSLLASAAEVMPERMVGLLLLTTDAEGGATVVGQVFSRLAAGLDSSLHLSHFLNLASANGLAGRGLAELLGVLTNPVEEQWSLAEQLAQTLCQLSTTVGGSRRLLQALDHISLLEEAGPLLACVLQRLCRTPEGMAFSLEMLGNFTTDKEGATRLGRLLARLADTRSGAADVLKALQSMAATVAGQRELARLIYDLAQGTDCARFLANLARQPFHAYRVQYLLDLLVQDGRSRKLMQFALDEMANCPRQRCHFQALESRLEALNPAALAC